MVAKLLTVVANYVHALCAHSHEVNAAASQSGYTIKPHYLPAIDEQKEPSLKVCCRHMAM